MPRGYKRHDLEVPCPWCGGTVGYILYGPSGSGHCVCALCEAHGPAAYGYTDSELRRAAIQKWKLRWKEHPEVEDVNDK